MRNNTQALCNDTQICVVLRKLCVVIRKLCIRLRTDAYAKLVYACTHVHEKLAYVRAYELLAYNYAKLAYNCVKVFFYFFDFKC